MDRMHTHDVVALTTLTSLFRVVVEKAYEQDDAFHEKLKENMPEAQLQELVIMEAHIDSTYSEPNYTRDHYIAILAFNERFLSTFTAVAGVDAIKAHVPEGQGNKAMAEDLTSLGCPTLARLFTPARAAKPS